MPNPPVHHVTAHRMIFEFPRVWYVSRLVNYTNFKLAVLFQMYIGYLQLQVFRGTQGSGARHRSSRGASYELATAWSKARCQTPAANMRLLMKVGDRGSTSQHQSIKRTSGVLCSSWDAHLAFCGRRRALQHSLVAWFCANKIKQANEGFRMWVPIRMAPREESR